MNDTIKIYCENTASELHVNPGTSMAQVIAMLAIRNPNPFLAGYVNNRLKELYYKIYSPVSLRFVDITHFEGMRVYQRTLFFVLQKAVSDLFPGQKLHIKHSVAKGFYCEIEGMEDITPDQLRAIDERMRELVAQDIPIIRQRLLSAERWPRRRVMCRFSGCINIIKAFTFRYRAAPTLRGWRTWCRSTRCSTYSANIRVGSMCSEWRRSVC